MAKRNDTSVKIDADVARKAKVLCSLDDITIAEYLTGILRPVVERDYADRIKKAANEQVKK